MELGRCLLLLVAVAALSGAAKPERSGDSGSSEETEPLHADLRTPSSCDPGPIVSSMVKAMGLELERVLREETAWSVAKELEVGREFAEVYGAMKGAKIVRGGPEQQYLEVVLQSLLDGLDRPDMPYVIALVEAPQVNAFAMPGGFVYINRGMIEAVRNEAQLAAVIAHEVRHVDKRHTVAALQYMEAAGLAPEMGDQVVAFLRHPYSSTLEEEADLTGLELVSRAGYSPVQSALLWDRFAQVESNSVVESSDPLTALLGGLVREVNALSESHPPARRRACLARRKASELHQAGGMGRYIGAQNLKQRVPAASQRF